MPTIEEKTFQMSLLSPIPGNYGTQNNKNITLESGNAKYGERTPVKEPQPRNKGLIGL